ncbi:MAG: hypothetical protein OEZ21_11215 [Candidatus Bathyarchaeota archaeon]|nr:hypothetical protein [Candidatus Bathyarchaeota archaeon]MDH5747500.1 hypothetical protein [Candidatus Bathyarchaeota archaeon]
MSWLGFFHLSSSTVFVTTTTEPFKSGSSIGLGDCCLFCGFSMCLLLESSRRLGVEYSVETAENVREYKELIVAGFGYVRDRRGIEIYRKRK